jgi:iron complex transport system substrate-binding protein
VSTALSGLRRIAQAVRSNRNVGCGSREKVASRNAGDSVTGFREFSNESLVAADPDYLLVSTMAGDPELMKKQVLSSNAFKRLTAVRKDHIVVLDSDEVMRPGPRVVDAIEQMARAFHPDRFRK